MRVDILTLFPETVGDVLSESILGRAQERGFIRIETHQIRDYTANKQNQVDDYPYGGGRGAVMTADPLYRCWEAVCDQAGGPVHTVYMSPCGHTFRQADAIRRAWEAIGRSLKGLRQGLTPDMVLIDVEEAMEAMGEVTGATVREDITARIFERFCVGK